MYGALRRIGPLLAVLPILVSGCGDQLEEFRNEALLPLERRAEQQKAQLSATLERVRLGDSQDVRLLGDQLKPLEATYAELAQLDPPADYSDTYAAYVEANAAFVAEMRKFIGALKERDRSTLNRASGRAREAIGAAQRAVQPLHE